GRLSTRRPYLLAVDHPLLAVLDGARLQPGEVRAGARFAEQLTPRLLAGDDVGEVALLLLVGAVGVDRGPGQQQAQPSRRAEGPELGDGLTHPHAVAAREALAVPLLGPRRRGPSRHAEQLPPLPDGEVGV